MAKKSDIIHRVEGIDEKELLATLARFGEDGTGKPAVEKPKERDERDKEIEPAPAEQDDVEIQEQDEVEPEALPVTGMKPAEVKKSRTENTYKSVFLNPKELKSRQCVYIGADLHDKIIAIVNEIALKSMTVGAFIDTVLRQHLEEHKDEINRLYRRKRDDLIE